MKNKIIAVDCSDLSFVDLNPDEVLVPPESISQSLVGFGGTEDNVCLELKDSGVIAWEGIETEDPKTLARAFIAMMYRASGLVNFNITSDITWEVNEDPILVLNLFRGTCYINEKIFQANHEDSLIMGMLDALEKMELF